MNMLRELEIPVKPCTSKAARAHLPPPKANESISPLMKNMLSPVHLYTCRTHNTAHVRRYWMTGSLLTLSNILSPAVFILMRTEYTQASDLSGRVNDC